MALRLDVSGVIFASLLAVAMSGCTTAPAPQGAAVSADSVGDRAWVVFNEVVVSLPFRGSNSPYQNLHVAPAAIVNVKNETSSSTYDAEWILRRMETRVAVRLSEVLGGLSWQSLADTASIRQLVLKESQAVVDEALRQWKYGADYKVDMVVASLYWTDASVGRLQQHGR